MSALELYLVGAALIASSRVSNQTLFFIIAGIALARIIEKVGTA